MKFGIVNPRAKTFGIVDTDIAAAYTLAHLDPRKTDHGVVAGLHNQHYACCVVYEFGFYVPALKQHYCAIGDRLIAGNALIYETDRYGHTVDLSDEAVAVCGKPTWFKTATDVVLAITAGAVDRPRLAINGEVIWAWPEPAPPDIAERME